MKIGILGTGTVGATLGTKLVQAGHQVMMGSRTATNEKAGQWAAAAGAGASRGTFADTARFGEIVFNCTAGAASLEALTLAGKSALTGKVLVDVANPLDFSKGMPPSLAVCNTDSLAEQIQRAFPDAKVVKAFNTMNCVVMVNPALVPGPHDLFLCGNDPGAKAQVRELATGAFGWKDENIVDLGDLTGARGMEMLLPIWLRLFLSLQNPNINFHVAMGRKTG